MTHASPTDERILRLNRPGGAGFWQSPWLWLGLALLALLPSLSTSILPFTDLPNHVARHYVFLNQPGDPFLQRFYSVDWALGGNLGVDLIVAAIGPWLGAELATHVAVSLIPPLTIAGIYALSRAFNGEVAPAALAATPLVINWPLLMGFTNFGLSAAIALLVLALWIRLRERPFWLRFLIFFPLAFVTWVAHTGGWALLGLGVGVYEIARATRPEFRLNALLLSPLQTAPFAAMLVVTALWRTGASNGAAIELGGNFLMHKAGSVASLFRERFLLWDALAALLFVGFILFFFFRGGRRLIWPAALIAAAYLTAFVICPQVVFNSAFADRRLLTYGALMVPLAIGLAPGVLEDAKTRRILSIGAAICVAFFAVRMLVTAAIWHNASEKHETRLTLIEAVPPQSRVFGLQVEPCGRRWNRVGEPDHIQQYAIVRRGSITNGMFRNPGLNQVEPRFPEAGPSGVDPNMYARVRDERCQVHYIKHSLQSAMRGFPREHFDYAWIISDEPLRPFDTQGLELVGSLGNDRLYRVARN